MVMNLCFYTRSIPRARPRARVRACAVFPARILPVLEGCFDSRDEEENAAGANGARVPFFRGFTTVGYAAEASAVMCKHCAIDSLHKYNV